ncbi:hypothetical protein [Rhizobium sp. 9140]|uniref:hypothetical protein n=1 Tax=Rhizobium sp. 9140 TaxID=1761900 RepID=UPI000799E15C|nr:hypothetical protein [Rhizobium sp. 9140]CZT36142.1 hypothetical protein GA0004734_00031440 [Rhizobium sp. 9140]
MTSEKTTAAAVANHKTENVKVTNGVGVPSTPGSEPANIQAATEIDPSGAPVQIVPGVDLEHPAVDANPRAGTTVAQNQIDFNDPNLSGSEAVAKMLRAQGVEIIADPANR